MKIILDFYYSYYYFFLNVKKIVDKLRIFDQFLNNF